MDFFGFTAKFLTHGLIVLIVGKHFSGECKGVGWEESGSNWFLIQQGKAQHFTTEESYEAPLEKTQKNHSTKTGPPREQELLGDRINLSGFSWWMESEVRLQEGRKKELGGKYTWKAGKVALVCNPRAQEARQKFKVKRLGIARAVQQGLTKKEKERK